MEHVRNSRISNVQCSTCQLHWECWILNAIHCLCSIRFRPVFNTRTSIADRLWRTDLKIEKWPCHVLWHIFRSGSSWELDDASVPECSRLASENCAISKDVPERGYNRTHDHGHFSILRSGIKPDQKCGYKTLFQTRFPNKNILFLFSFFCGMNKHICVSCAVNRDNGRTISVFIQLISFRLLILLRPNERTNTPPNDTFISFSILDLKVILESNGTDAMTTKIEALHSATRRWCLEKYAHFEVGDNDDTMYSYISNDFSMETSTSLWRNWNERME